MDRYQITKIREVKTTTTGKEYTILDLVLDGSSSHYENVKVWRGHKEYANIEEGGLITGKIKSDPKYGYSLGDGQYTKKPFTQPSYSQPVVNTRQTNQFIDRKAEHIEEAQKRKDTSIGFFNATNSAIQVVEKLMTEKMLPPFATEAEMLKKVFSIRDKFMAEFKEFQASSLEEKTVPFGSKKDELNDMEF